MQSARSDVKELQPIRDLDVAAKYGSEMEQYSGCSTAKHLETTGDRKMVLRGQWTQETVTVRTITPLHADFVCTNLHATSAAIQTEQKFSAKTA